MELIEQEQKSKVAPPAWSKSAKSEIEKESAASNPIFVDAPVVVPESRDRKSSGTKAPSRKQSRGEKKPEFEELGDIAFDSRAQSMQDVTDGLQESQKSLGQLTFKTDVETIKLGIEDGDPDIDDFKESQKSLGQITFRSDVPDLKGGTETPTLFDSQKLVPIPDESKTTTAKTEVRDSVSSVEIFYDSAKIIPVGQAAASSEPVEDILEFPDDMDAKDMNLESAEVVPDVFVEGGIIEEEEPIDFLQSGMLDFMASKESVGALPQISQPFPATSVSQSPKIDKPIKPKEQELDVGEELVIEDETDETNMDQIDAALKMESQKPAPIDDTKAPDQLALSTRSSSSDNYPSFGSDPSSLVAMLGSILEHKTSTESMFSPNTDANIPDSIKNILNSVALDMKTSSNSPPMLSVSVDEYEEDDIDDALDQMDSMAVDHPIAEDEEFHGSSSQSKPKALVSKTSNGPSSAKMQRASSDPADQPSPVHLSKSNSLTITLSSPTAAPETPKSTKSFKKPISLSDLVSSESTQYSAPAVKASPRSSPTAEFNFQEPNRRMSASLDTGSLLLGSPRDVDGSSSPMNRSGGRKSKFADQMAKEIEEAKRVAEIQAKMQEKRKSLIARCSSEAESEEKRKAVLQDAEEQARLRKVADEFKRLEDEQQAKIEAEQTMQRLADAETRERIKQDEDALIAKARSGKRMSFYEKRLAEKALGVSDEEEETVSRGRRHSSMLSERPDVMKLAVSPRFTDEVKKTMEDVERQLEMRVEFWKSLGNIEAAIAKLKEDNTQTTDLTMNVSAALDQYPLGDPERLRLTKELANAIADNSHLVTIDLSNSKLDDVFAAELGARLEQGACPQLESLNLEDNCFTGKGVQCICDGFQDMLKHGQIRNIKLGNQSAITTEAEQAALNMLKFNLCITALTVDFRRQIDYVEATRLLSRNAGFASQKKAKLRKTTM
jgi:hypothetical protein